MSYHQFTDDQGDRWYVARDAQAGTYIAAMSEVYPFDVAVNGRIEKWSASYDRNEREFVVEGVESTSGYNQDVGEFAHSIDALRTRFAHALPDDIAGKLERDAGRPAPNWGDSGELTTLHALERALAGHVTLPEAVRTQLAAEELPSRAAAQAAAVARLGQPPATRAAITAPTNDLQREAHCPTPHTRGFGLGE